MIYIEFLNGYLSDKYPSSRDYGYIETSVQFLTYQDTMTRVNKFTESECTTELMFTGTLNIIIDVYIYSAFGDLIDTIQVKDTFTSNDEIKFKNISIETKDQVFELCLETKTYI